MLPSRHIIVSLPLGAVVGFFTESLSAGLLCFFSGVLIDFDHVIDYVINFGLKSFNFKRLYQTYIRLSRREESDMKKLYLFFHAIEFAILLWIALIFIKNKYLLAIALGYTAHLITDVATNILKPWSYFITLRIKNGFSVIKFVKLCSNP